jgi:hypothetical protein
VFASLHKNARVKQMAETRLAELKSLAYELVEEGKTVARNEEERAAIRSMLLQIQPEADPSLSDEDLWDRLGPRPVEDVWKWRQRLPDAARERLRTKLLPGTFDQLRDSSQADLIRTEVAYSTTLNDLSHCAHLLARVVERELRERIILPAARALFPQSENLGGFRQSTLGQIFDHLKAAMGCPTPSDSNVGQLRQYLASALAPMKDDIEEILRLRAPIFRIDEVPGLPGMGFRLVSLRNAVAHGDLESSFQNMNRLTIDALKRALILDGDPPILARIARISLCVSEQMTNHAS